MQELKAGITPGGFTNITEIKLIICYLLFFCKEPLSREQIFDILDFNGIVNYFYFTQAFEELLKSGQVCKQGDGVELSLVDRESVMVLKDKISKTVREKLEISAENYVNKILFKKWHNIDVKKEDYGFTIRCGIKDDLNNLMSITLFVPEKNLINKIKKRFWENSEEIYKQIVSILTGETLS